jgi:hypothetical protein
LALTATAAIVLLVTELSDAADITFLLSGAPNGILPDKGANASNGHVQWRTQL